MTCRHVNSTYTSQLITVMERSKLCWHI